MTQDITPPSDSDDTTSGRTTTHVFYDAIITARHRLERDHGPIRRVRAYVHPEDHHTLCRDSAWLNPGEEVGHAADATVKRSREVPEGCILVKTTTETVGTAPFAIERLDNHRDK